MTTANLERHRETANFSFREIEEEDEEDTSSGLGSPSVSEDSVDVRVSEISVKNKRKVPAQPDCKQSCSRSPSIWDTASPIKRRKRRLRCKESILEEDYENSQSVKDKQDIFSGDDGKSSCLGGPFRPWSGSVENGQDLSSSNLRPASLVTSGSVESQEERPISLVVRGTADPPRIPSHPAVTPQLLQHHSEAHSPSPPELQFRARSSSSKKPSIEKLEGHVAEHPSTFAFDLEGHSEGRTTSSSLSRRLPSHHHHPAVIPEFARHSGGHSEGHSEGHSSSTPRMASEPTTFIPEFEGHSSSLPSDTNSYSLQNNWMHLIGTIRGDASQQSAVPSGEEKLPSRNNGLLLQQQQQQQRHYKIMTRERRIEANARERTRVHTISAAFETLRKSIPAYSHNQKLSKLSVLRIACQYIMTLGSVLDSSKQQFDPNRLGTCVDLVSRTIRSEGKIRSKKKDD